MFLSAWLQIGCAVYILEFGVTQCCSTLMCGVTSLIIRDKKTLASVDFANAFSHLTMVYVGTLPATPHDNILHHGTQ